ncbi:HDOD domain-containing protein [Chromobacterium piscinae]|uniref:HDOD domain-containing protein n=1 Tax=Chromobacterium piscinae TaxID=686831 RepID=UPI001409D757|nr:HDOD domain-containing protein [Chromobacterium piscinae]MCD4505737.1 HDOD domain-containing protein [Chromobacterium piscinae]NHQ80651.1 HDOD domain-containing protein [Chromobacterium vaccinii]
MQAECADRASKTKRNDSRSGKMLSRHQQGWGVEQWAAYLKDKDIPVLSATRDIFQSLKSQGKDAPEFSPRELVEMVHDDPYLAVKLLIEAERHRSRRLGKETTTQLATILQLGSDELYSLISRSPVVNVDHPGWKAAVSTAVMASSIARAWSNFRADTSPEEISLATLLSETGDLLLWHFAPELPTAAIAEFESGRANRTGLAQLNTAGFTFRQLTLALADIWQLPQMISQLIRGVDRPRTHIAQIAIDCARHLTQDPDNPALPFDIDNISQYIPGVAKEKLISVLPLSDEQKTHILAGQQGA